MAADRELQLASHEVYRFGANEVFGTEMRLFAFFSRRLELRVVRLSG